MKKIISVVLTIAMIFIISAMPISAADAVTVVASGDCTFDASSNVTWTYYSDGKITFTGNGTMKTYNNGQQPWFSYMGSITEAEFGDGLTRVSSYALYNATNMTTVTIGSTVTEIGGEAFRMCSKLAELNFTPKTTCTIGDYAFERSGFTTLILPEGITSVGEYAFNNLQGTLQNIYLPSTLQTIGSAAFRNAGKLAKVVIPKDIASIPDNAFESGGFQVGYNTKFYVVESSAGETFARGVNSLNSNYNYTYELIDYSSVTKQIAWQIKNDVFSVTAGLGTSSQNPPQVSNLNVEGSVLVGETVKLSYDFVGTEDASIAFVMSEGEDGKLSLEKYFVGDNSIDFELSDSLKRKTLKMIVLPMDNTGDFGTAKELVIGTVVPEYEITMTISSVWGNTLNASISYEFNKNPKNLLAVLCQFDSSNKMVKADYAWVLPTLGATGTLPVKDSETNTADISAHTDAVNAKLYLWEGTDLVNTTMTSLKDFIELNK